MECKDNIQPNQVGMCSIREFDEGKDYDDIKSWFEHFKDVVAPSRETLSLDGVITEYYNQKICVGWLYTTNSNVALIEFIISNPEAKRDVRRECLKKVLTRLESIAKTKGYELLLNITSNVHLSKTLEGLGYHRGYIPHYENIKVL